MKTFEIKSKNIIKDIYRQIVNCKYGAAWCIQDEDVILVPKAGIVDEQACYNMGYRIYEAFYSGGGAIVVSKGDVAIAHFGELQNDFCQRFIEHFVTWLKERGLNATADHNDVLVDGCKVCGTVTTRYNCMMYTAAHIGINTNLDHIKMICTKPMIKVPKGLGEYGITAEEIRDMYIAFCEEQ